MLKTNPQLVHFNEIVHDKVIRIFDCTLLGILPVGEFVSQGLQEIVPQKESSDWILYTFDRLRQVVEN